MDNAQTKPESLANLQRIGLGILLDIDRVCRLHGLTYYLAEGTLLGAVRHEGFIPWDDDVDIAMPREDYTRFLEVAPADLGEGYEVQHPGSVTDYWSPFAKVRLLDESSGFRQTHIAHLTRNNGPLVDIFPLDCVAKKSGVALSARGAFIRLNRAAITQKLRMNPTNSLSKLIARLYGSLTPLRSIHRRLMWAQTMCRPRDCNYLANFCSYYPIHKQVFPTEYYGTPRLHEFEGYALPIPQRAEDILRRVYGDYLSLPPIDQQRSKHHFQSPTS